MKAMLGMLSETLIFTFLDFIFIGCAAHTFINLAPFNNNAFRYSCLEQRYFP